MLRALFEQRDEMAVKRDSPVFHFASDGILWLMAEHLPKNIEELLSSVQAKHHGIVRRYSDIWLPIIEAARDDERPIPSMPSKPLRRKKNRWMNDIITQVRDWRLEQKELGLHDFLLPTNNQIKDLAFDLPTSITEVQASTSCLMAVGTLGAISVGNVEIAINCHTTLTSYCISSRYITYVNVEDICD